MAGFFDEVREFFSGPSKAGTARHTLVGFDPKKTKEFKKAAGQLATARKRVDPETAAPQLQRMKVTTQQLNRFLRDPKTSPLRGSEEQMKGFISAFAQRQEEVFGRRARPGISQTRLV